MPARTKPWRSAPALLLLAALPLHSQLAAPAWPTPQAIERARASHPFPDTERLQRVPLPSLPRIAPAPPALDIAEIAKRYLHLKTQTEGTAAAPSLRIFVSLSMPAASLRLLVTQAERAGAILTLRGLKANSMKQTLDAVQALIGESRVQWQIDPEAYTRYRVRHAPTFVLTANGTTSDHDNADCGTRCPTNGTFYSVAGDVSLDYALDTLVRRHPGAQGHASPYLQRLRPTP